MVNVRYKKEIIKKILVFYALAHLVFDTAKSLQSPFIVPYLYFCVLFAKNKQHKEPQRQQQLHEDNGNCLFFFFFEMSKNWHWVVSQGTNVKGMRNSGQMISIFTHDLCLIQILSHAVGWILYILMIYVRLSIFSLMTFCGEGI